jgi:hypothetical protein
LTLTNPNIQSLIECTRLMQMTCLPIVLSVRSGSPCRPDADERDLS